MPTVLRIGHCRFHKDFGTHGMTFSTLEKTPAIDAVTVDPRMLTFTLRNARVVIAPLTWFPRLREATQDERENWRMIGAGHGVHWPDLDEDVSVESLLLGQGSMESTRSLETWRASRRDTTPHARVNHPRPEGK